MIWIKRGEMGVKLIERKKEHPIKWRKVPVWHSDEELKSWKQNDLGSILTWTLHRKGIYFEFNKPQSPQLWHGNTEPIYVLPWRLNGIIQVKLLRRVLDTYINRELFLFLYELKGRTCNLSIIQLWYWGSHSLSSLTCHCKKIIFH